MTARLASIVIPTYNRPCLLDEAVRSALAQTYPAVEVVVVDDGSSDDLGPVREEFAGRIRWLRQAHSGVGAARNTGWRAARGEWIAFLDDDDRLLPQCIARKVEYLEEHPEAGMVFSDVYLIDEGGVRQGRYMTERNGRLPSGDLYEALLPRNFIPTHAPLWRRETLEQAGGFPSRSVGEDWELLLRAAETARFDYLDEPLGEYRLHRQNMTHKRRQLVQGYAIVQTMVARSPRFGQVARPVQARVLTRYAAQQWLEGDPALAGCFLGMAKRVWPYHVQVWCLQCLMRLKPASVRPWVYRWWKWRSKRQRQITATAYFRQGR